MFGRVEARLVVTDFLIEEPVELGEPSDGDVGVQVGRAELEKCERDQRGPAQRLRVTVREDMRMRLGRERGKGLFGGKHDCGWRMDRVG